MFKLVTKLVAPWPVTLSVVTASGAVEEQTATLKFERIGQKEFDALFAAPASEEAARAQNLKIFDRVVRGWEGIVDAAGDPVPFSSAAALQLMDFPGFPAALGRAYVAFHLAQPAARQEALGKSPAGGQEAAPQTAATPPTATA
jgi:hypothetical protein